MSTYLHNKSIKISVEKNHRNSESVPPQGREASNMRAEVREGNGFNSV